MVAQLQAIVADKEAKVKQLEEEIKQCKLNVSISVTGHVTAFQTFQRWIKLHVNDFIFVKYYQLLTVYYISYAHTCAYIYMYIFKFLFVESPESSDEWRHCVVRARIFKDGIGNE